MFSSDFPVVFFFYAVESGLSTGRAEFLRPFARTPAHSSPPKPQGLVQHRRLQQRSAPLPQVPLATPLTTLATSQPKTRACVRKPLQIRGFIVL